MSENTQDIPEIIAPPPIIYLGFLVLGLILNFLFPISFLPGALMLIIGVPLIALGFVVAVSALQALGRANTSPDPWEPTQAIVADGAYRFTRNPIYVAFTLIYLGVTVAFNALWALLLLVLVLVIIDRGVIVREEKYLERKFGKQYLDYKAKVRRWI